ncbi:S-layer homology domain-containing protein [Paenibacillus chungangensis]|uniref:S-layer homology domain-containing protein n=1 Tax=Paenibacillus chungangensis TaxID=696535 RepID=A0ABW3HQF2_9BACL
MRFTGRGKSFIVFLCMVMVALSMAGTPQAAVRAELAQPPVIQEELFNFGFEEGEVDGAIPGWTQNFGVGKNGSVTVDSTNVLEGNWSLKITDNDNTSLFGMDSDKFAVEKGKLYTVTSSVYIGSGSNIQLQIRYYGENDVLLQPIKTHNDNYQNAPTNVWQTITVSDIAPAEAVSASVVVVNAKSSRGVSYWDNMVVTKQAVPEEPEPEPSDPVRFLANASFEESGADSMIPNWTIKSGTPTVSSEQAAVGNNSLKLHLVENQGQSAINIESDLMDVEENATYVFSAQVLLELGGIQGFYVYVYDKNGELVKSADNKDFHMYAAETKPDGKWKYIQQAFTVQPGGAKLKVALITGAKRSFTFYVDEVSVLKQVVNGNFEQPVSDGVIPGWSKTKPADADSFTLSSEYKDEGEYSLHIKNTPGQYINVISDLIPVEAGATYTAVSRSLVETRSADMYLRFFDENGAYMNKQSWNIAGEPFGEWFDQYIVAEAPEGAHYAAILFAGSDRRTYSYYIDNIQLMRGNHEMKEEPLPEDSITILGENLGPQIRKATMMRGAVGKDGEGRDVVYSVVAGAPSIFTMIDIETEQVVKSIPMPDTSGAWSVTMSSDGSVYMGAYNLGLLYRYIPSTDELVNLGHPLSTKDSVLYPMAAGKDGVMYGSTYPTAHLYAYDPSTNAYTDYGTMSTLTSGERWTRVTVYDEETHKIYAGVGNVPRLLEYDLATGAKRDLLPAGFENIVSVYDLNLADGRLFARKEANNGNETFVVDIASGDLVEVTNADTGEKSTTFINFSRGMSPVSPVANKLYFAGAGGELFEYDLDTNSYRSTGASIEGAAIGYAFVELNEAGFPGYSLVGLSGNSGKMFKYNLETGAVRLTDIQVPAEPVNIHEIVKGPDGKIYTAGYLQGNLGVYTPSTGDSMYYEGIGQGEGMTVIHNKLYLGVYPGASIMEYDLAQPWNRTNADKLNPNRLFTLGDLNQDRPFGMAGAEDYNKLFVGTVPKNGMLGGALAVYDLKERGEPEVYENIIPNQSVLSLVYKDGLLYGGTSIHGGQGGVPTATEARLFVWDVLNKEIVFETVPAPGRQAITALHLGPDGNVWGLANGELFIFDTVTRQVIHSQNAFPGAVGRWIDGSMETGTDGNVYATVAGKFFKVDAATKEVTVLASGVRKLAQDDFGSFYMYTDPESPNLYKYTIDELILKLTGAELSIEAAELEVGETTKIELLGLLEKDRTTKDLSGAEISYTVGNPVVASIDGEGVVTAMQAGSTELFATVKLNGMSVESNTIQLTVTTKEGGRGGSSSTGGTLGETIEVTVGADGEQDERPGVKLSIIRTKQSNGTIQDELHLDEQKTKEIIERLDSAGGGSKVAVIPMPDEEDEVGEWLFNIDQEAAQLLSEADVELVLANGNVKVVIPAASLQQLNEGIYFRITPLRSDDEKMAIESRANTDEAIAEVERNEGIEAIGRPIRIETNLQGKLVMLTLPIDPDVYDEAEWGQLGVYIEHSDGSRSLVGGEVVDMNRSGQKGLRIEVDSFSVFTMVQVQGWQEVEVAAVPKYMHGYEDGTFRPNNPVTRAEVAAMLSRIAGSDTDAGSSPSEDRVFFDDVPRSHWAHSSVLQTIQLQWMKGYPDGGFKPDRAITRAEMATVLLQLIESAEQESRAAINGVAVAGVLESSANSSSAAFSDMDGHWSEETVAKLQALGVISGYMDGTFRPDQSLTRAEAVKMMNELLGIEPDADGAPIWNDVPSNHWAYGAIQAVSVKE